MLGPNKLSFPSPPNQNKTKNTKKLEMGKNPLAKMKTDHQHMFCSQASEHSFSIFHQFHKQSVSWHLTLYSITIQSGTWYTILENSYNTHKNNSKVETNLSHGTMTDVSKPPLYARTTLFNLPRKPLPLLSTSLSLDRTAFIAVSDTSYDQGLIKDTSSYNSRSDSANE